MEDDDDAGARQPERAALPEVPRPAGGAPHVGHAPVQRHFVRRHDVELVDVPQPLRPVGCVLGYLLGRNRFEFIRYKDSGHQKGRLIMLSVNRTQKPE